MAKKYGPKDELEIISKIKFKKDDISGKMSIADVEKRISSLRDELETSGKIV